MKWYTKTQYVDQQTGEILNKIEVEKKYIIIKKEKNDTQHEIWGSPNYNGTRTKEYYTIRTWTYICTRAGKQITIW